MLCCVVRACTCACAAIRACLCRHRDASVVRPLVHFVAECRRSRVAFGRTMEWTNKLTFEFLNLYQNEPSLWNFNAAEHKNKNDSHFAWSRIQSQLRGSNVTIKELKRKRDNLMSTYRRLRTKVKDSESGGKGAEHIYKPDWPFYLRMSVFLDDMYIPKKTKNSEDIELPEEYGGSEEDDGGKEMKYSTFKSPEKLLKRRKTDKAEEAEKRMDEVYNYVKIMAENSVRDECSLYTDLMCKKLRALEESTREKAMLEIDRYIYNLRQKDLLQQPSPSSQYFAQSNLSPTCQLAYSPQTSPNPHFLLQPKSSPYSQHSSESNPSPTYQLAYSPQSSQNPQLITKLKSSPHSQHSSDSNPGYELVYSSESSLNTSQSQLIPPHSLPDEHSTHLPQTKINEENSDLNEVCKSNIS